MEYTKEDIERLRSYAVNIDSDDIKIKEKIKELLLNNKDLIHVLNNKELEETDAEPDEYYGINILPMYLIHPTQSDVQNFVCFTTSYNELNHYNSVEKLQQIVFTVLCEQKNIIDEDTGLARHDLLGAIIMNQFEHTNYFGAKIHCISNKETTVDNDYAARILIFEQSTDANVVKTRNGVPKIINKDVVQ